MSVNSYNGKVETWLAPGVVNRLWSAMKQADGTTAVVLGTSNVTLVVGDFSNSFLSHTADPSQLGKTLYIFNKNDKVFMNDYTVLCNFADGLIDVSDKAFSPGSIFADPAVQQAITNNLVLQIQAFRVLADASTLPMGNLQYPIMGFNQQHEINQFENQIFLSSQEETDLGFYIGVALGKVGTPLWSTVGIDAGFAATRLRMDVTMTLSHTLQPVSPV